MVHWLDMFRGGITLSSFLKLILIHFSNMTHQIEA